MSIKDNDRELERILEEKEKMVVNPTALRLDGNVNIVADTVGNITIDITDRFYTSTPNDTVSMPNHYNLSSLSELLDMCYEEKLKFDSNIHGGEVYFHWNGFTVFPYRDAGENFIKFNLTSPTVSNFVANDITGLYRAFSPLLTIDGNEINQINNFRHSMLTTKLFIIDKEHFATMHLHNCESIYYHLWDTHVGELPFECYDVEHLISACEYAIYTPTYTADDVGECLNVCLNSELNLIDNRSRFVVYFDGYKIIIINNCYIVNNATLNSYCELGTFYELVRYMLMRYHQSMSCPTVNDPHYDLRSFDNFERFWVNEKALVIVLNDCVFGVAQRCSERCEFTLYRINEREGETRTFATGEEMRREMDRLNDGGEWMCR